MMRRRLPGFVLLLLGSAALLAAASASSGCAAPAAGGEGAAVEGGAAGGAAPKAPAAGERRPIGRERGGKGGRRIVLASREPGPVGGEPMPVVEGPKPVDRESVPPSAEGAIRPAGFVVEVRPGGGAGFSWPYLLYGPCCAAEGQREKSGKDSRGPPREGACPRAEPGATASRLVLLVSPNNTGRVSDDFALHEKAARRSFRRLRERAAALGCAALMPVFPRPESRWRLYTHALDRDCLTTRLPGLERLDLQLIAMIDDARRRLAVQAGREVERRVLLAGFSASGMFANRFACLHPDRVMAAAIGSPGGWPIVPVAEWEGERLPYPAGVADLDALAGEPFDAARFRGISFFFFLGGADENDSLPFADGWEKENADRVDRLFGKSMVRRFEAARKIYEAAGAEALFRVYPGAGHEITPGMDRDVKAFFEAALVRRGKDGGGAGPPPAARNGADPGQAAGIGRR